MGKGLKYLGVVRNGQDNEFTVPSEVRSDQGVYILAVANLYHAGGVFVMSFGTNASASYMSFVTIKATDFFSVSLTSYPKFSIRGNGADGQAYLLAIAL